MTKAASETEQSAASRVYARFRCQGLELANGVLSANGVAMSMSPGAVAAARVVQAPDHGIRLR